MCVIYVTPGKNKAIESGEFLDIVNKTKNLSYNVLVFLFCLEQTLVNAYTTQHYTRNTVKGMQYNQTAELQLSKKKGRFILLCVCCRLGTDAQFTRHCGSLQLHKYLAAVGPLAHRQTYRLCVCVNCSRQTGRLLASALRYQQ